MSRVKDPENFIAELEQPLDGTREVTDAELERDEASFMAFAAAFGVKPGADGGVAAALPSPQPSRAEG